MLIPEAGLALRGTFIIDPKQNLRVAHIHDLPIGRSVDETLRVIEAIKFTDEHGEVKNLPFWDRDGKKIVLANNDVCLRYAPLTGRKAKRLSSPTPRTPRNTLKLSTNKDYNVAVCAFCKRPRLSESGVTSTKTTE